jgi:transcriptional regulator with XRE-family HTH domain
MSQSYISQIEGGARPHLTNTTRQILAGFFKVHPGYLVDDPEGYHPELMSELRNVEDKLDLWLVNGAERFQRDPELMSALLVLARHERTRECLLMLEAIIETPGLMPRLIEVLRPTFASRPLKSNNGPVKTNGGAKKLTATKQVAENLEISAADEGKRASVAKATAYLAGLKPGINPRPTTRTSFSAGSKSPARKRVRK